MELQQQIDWLIKQVNALNDVGCGCTSCEKTNFNLGELKFKWGKANNNELETDYITTTQIISDDGDIKNNIDVTVYNLLVEVPFWEEIKDLSPVILIDRYRKKTFKGYDKLNFIEKYRKSGYKHELQTDAQLNGRINELPLTDGKNILYFNQENYFGYNHVNGLVYTKGAGKKRGQSNVKFQNIKLGAYIYLGFRLRLTDNDGIITETGHLGFLKMYVINDFITYKIQ